MPGCAFALVKFKVRKYTLSLPVIYTFLVCLICVTIWFSFAIMIIVFPSFQEEEPAAEEGNDCCILLSETRHINDDPVLF